MPEKNRESERSLGVAFTDIHLPSDSGMRRKGGRDIPEAVRADGSVEIHEHG